MGKVIETVTAPEYRYVARCTRTDCYYRVGLNDLPILRSTSQAHAFATGHTVQIEDTAGDQKKVEGAAS